MRLLGWVTCIVCAVGLPGCGGGSAGPGTPAMPPPDDGPLQIGPLLVHPQSAAGFRADSIPSGGHASFVAFSGTTVDYLAVQEMMDRIVFTSNRAGADYDVYVCDFFGGHVQKMTENAVHDELPAWSHDGRKIAWGKKKGADFEIAVMNADGGSPHLLTSNLYNDSHPTWSPDGRRIAYESDYGGDYEITTQYIEGSAPWPLTSNTANDRHPDWDRYSNQILFATDREGNMMDIYRMDGQGGNEVAVTDATPLGVYAGPTWATDHFTIAYYRDIMFDPHSAEIFTDNINGSNQELFATSEYRDEYPCYSTDGEFLVFASSRDGSGEIYAKETSFPYRIYQITKAPYASGEPDAGSPVPTVRRVLIGPAGSDHGYDPLFGYCYAGIAAFDGDGYLSFARVGVPAIHADTILVTPLEDTGMDLVAVRVKATEIANAREDAGPGRDPTLWNFAATGTGAVVFYLDSDTGKIASVLAISDSPYPSAARVGGAVTTAAQNGRTQVTGHFAAVYDDTGALVAEGVGTVEFQGARLVRAF